MKFAVSIAIALLVVVPVVIYAAWDIRRIYRRTEKELAASRAWWERRSKQMNTGKCFAPGCGYVNESPTAMCARADCPLSVDLAATKPAIACGVKLGGLTCELALGHTDLHQMGRCRWNSAAQ